MQRAPFMLLLSCVEPAMAQMPAPDRAACEAIVARADRDAAVPGAAFQPGVDVRGNAVAGPDLNPRPEIALPEEFRIPVQPLVGAFLDRPLPPALEGMRAAAGELVVRLSDGRVTFNGVVVGGDTDAALIEACRNLLAPPPADDAAPPAP
ncbi:MAG: hypothetical protein O2905_00295 [Proteobacteria bacterium]|nr:hypothetical protein [Pseudomonadota bacterium]MDA1131650.1 hypothetical protein [Pseudomonadota bacterium]